MKVYLVHHVDALSAEQDPQRHISAKGNVKFRSVIGNSATPGGLRHREALLTNATPTRQATRLSITTSSDAS